MGRLGNLEVGEKGVSDALKAVFRNLLEKGAVDALLIPRRLAEGRGIMPALITDPEHLQGVDPLAPAFPLNAARILSRLTRRPVAERIAAVLRPCEIRAFVELVKLNQGSRQGVILIGMDCFGAYGNEDYRRFVANEEGEDSTGRFLEAVMSGKGAAVNGVDISPACKSCVHPVAQGADLVVELLGSGAGGPIVLHGMSEIGAKLLETLGLEESSGLAGREEEIARLVEVRTAYRDRMFEQSSEATKDLDRLIAYFSDCVNCYNCRVACPVCYCKECVFATDVFDHEPAQYLRWAQRKGSVKMPTDTLFYHLTRMAHMSTACVGCGQCSNACPNNIPVAEIFRTVAHYTQRAFGYEAGRSLDEAPPLSEFREKELAEITGGRD